MKNKSVVTTDRREREAIAGFTLLEVIVALTILSLALVVILHVIADTVGRTSQAETINQARLLAQSLLDQVGKAIPAKVGTLDGKGERGLQWQIRQKLYDRPTETGRWQILEVAVEVSWSHFPYKRSIVLSTLRQGPSP